jgi:hypothetical protein
VVQCETNGTWSECPDGSVCRPAAKCFTLACENFTVSAQPCALDGVCAAASSAATSAALQPDGRTVLVALSAPARAAQFACSRLFDAPSSALLGAGASCAADAGGASLAVRLPGGTAVMPGAPLAFRRGQEALVDDLSATPFAGNFSVAGCAPACAPPVAVLVAPPVSRARGRLGKLDWSAHLDVCLPATSSFPFLTPKTHPTPRQALVKPCRANASADALLDASLSYDPSGRPLRSVAWAFAPGSATDDALQALLDQATAARWAAPPGRGVSSGGGAFLPRESRQTGLLRSLLSRLL